MIRFGKPVSTFPDHALISCSCRRFLRAIAALFARGRLFGRRTLENIHQRNDDTVDLVVDRAIGTNAHVVAAAAAAADFTADRREIREHGSRPPSLNTLFVVGGG